MTAPIVLRVRLDTSAPSDPRGCEACWLRHYSEQSELSFCVAAPRDEDDSLRVVKSYGPAPSWCPLRTGPVTVEAAP